jgi:hypothetical protein
MIVDASGRFWCSIDADRLLSECPNCGEYYALPQLVDVTRYGCGLLIQDEWVYLLFECRCGASWSVGWHVY